MFSKEMPKIIRSFYRNIINKGKENGEIIRLGSNSYNIKNYKVYKWSCCNSNFPTFYSGGSYGKYNSLRDTFILLAKQKPEKSDETNLRLINIGLKNNFYENTIL